MTPGQISSLHCTTWPSSTTCPWPNSGGPRWPPTSTPRRSARRPPPTGSAATPHPRRGGGSCWERSTATRWASWGSCSRPTRGSWIAGRGWIRRRWPGSRKATPAATAPSTGSVLRWKGGPPMAEFVPTPEQEAALGAPTPLLILAGAGTGKTTVLTHRIANLIAEGKARPEELLALTFAEKAATEMSERLAGLLSQRGLGDAGREVHCSTFHSFGAEIIRDNATLLGREADCRVLSTPESWQLLSRIVDQMEFDAVELPMNGLGTILSGMLGFFSQASDQMVTPERLSAFAESQDLSGASEMVAEKWGKRLAQLREVVECYRRYRDAKLERGYLDYGDLLTLPVQIFREHPEVRDSYRARFPHLF